MFVHGKSELPATSGCNFKLNARKAHFYLLTRAHHLVIEQLRTRHRKRTRFCTMWMNPNAQNSYLWYEGAEYISRNLIFLILWIMHGVSLFQQTLCGVFIACLNACSRSKTLPTPSVSVDAFNGSHWFILHYPHQASASYPISSIDLASTLTLAQTLGVGTP